MAKKKVIKKKLVAKAKKSTKIGPKGKAKVEKAMHDFKEGQMHSGKKTGPVVTNRKQAIAIALSQGRAVSKKKSKKTVK